MFTDFKDIDTPALLIEKSRMKNNLLEMQIIANIFGVQLRPHIKTHKMPRLANEQLKLGACGIAVAKLSEAEVMQTNGINDIQIANIITGQIKIKRLIELLKITKRITCCVDSAYNVNELSNELTGTGLTLDVFIKINAGLDRCGLTDFEEILKLAQLITSKNNLKLAGLLTHAGQGYSAKNLTELEEIGTYEGTFMVNIANYLRSNNIEINEISVGSTPTASFCSKVDGVTELRAGNYIFYDMIQVSIGSAETEDCALSILSTVISNPANNRAIIDAGSKALGRDKGAHSIDNLDGYGYINNKNATIARLSEEHGIIIYDNESFNIGERVRIIPNHACAVVNNFNKAYLVDGSEIIEEIKIEARGMMI